MSDKKRKVKGKWHMPNAKRRKFALCPDLKGFLLFCNSKERETIRDAYVILNQFAERMYGPELNTLEYKQEDKKSNGSSEIENEIEDELDREKEILKLQSSKVESERRFQVIESGIQNVLFIRTTVEDPVALVTEILKDIAETNVQKSRHLIRLIPIQKTCKAFEGPVREATKMILTPHYKGEDIAKEEIAGSKDNRGINLNTSDIPSYCVIFKSRLNNNFLKQDAIDIVVGLMKDLCPNAKVDYKAPDLSIVFEIMKSHCCLSVLPNYYKYKKYNLIELANTVPETVMEADVSKHIKSEDCAKVDD